MSKNSYFIPTLIVVAAVLVALFMLLFRAQPAPIDTILAGYAQELELDVSQFQACLSTNKYLDEVTDDYNYALDHGLNATPSFFINGRYIRGALSFQGFSEIIEQELTQTAPEDIERYDISIDDDPIMGAPESPITMIEFSEFECPACAQYHQIVFPEIVNNYIQSGELRYIMRDFPLPQLHPYAVRLAEAANCAGEQGKYWEMHDLLFNTQSERKQSY